MVAIREVSDKDLSRLAEYLPTQPRFLRTTKEVWKRRFEIWWDKNPAFTSQLPRGWVLENETSFMGFIGNIPVKFLMSGEEKTAVAAMTYYVDPSVRGFISISLLLEFLKQKNASLYLFNTDKEDLMKLLNKNKFKKFILPRFQTKYYRVLQPSRIIPVLIRLGILKRFKNFPSLCEILKEMGSFMRGFLAQKPLARLSPSEEKKYATSLCTSCDDSFFKIWGSSLNRCDITMSRDTQTLNWLYFSSIEPSQRVVIQCRRTRDNSLAGYMVFDLQRTTPSETAFMRLMDLCIERNDREVYISLLQFAAKTGKQNNAAVLELWALDEETETYLQNNFTIRRAAQHHNFYRFTGIPEVQAESLTICPSMIAPPRGTDH
jgi:hypothetical protein